MKVTLKTITPDAELNILEIARLSSTKEDKSEPGLINYLIKNHHWSPFEHSFLTWEIETSKAIGIQLLRHRSNYFQEFSQRYQDVRVLGDVLEPIELRQQATTNRQSSTEVFDPWLKMCMEGPSGESDLFDGHASHFIEWYQRVGLHLYEALLEAQVARETARFILPMNTKTKMIVTQNVRSLIHWMDLRDDGHAQKEVQLIAQEIKKIAIEKLPIISKARGWTTQS